MQSSTRSLFEPAALGLAERIMKVPSAQLLDWSLRTRTMLIIISPSWVSVPEEV